MGTEFENSVKKMERAEGMKDEDQKKELGILSQHNNELRAQVSLLEDKYDLLADNFRIKNDSYEEMKILVASLTTHKEHLTRKGETYNKMYSDTVAELTNLVKLKALPPRECTLNEKIKELEILLK